MSYEYIPTATKFCDSSTCDECEEMELIGTNKEHDDTKENLLESADESLLEIESGVPSTNKTVLRPKHDDTKVDVEDYSNRVQDLEKQIKDNSYNLHELEEATRTEIKNFVENYKSKDDELQSSIDDTQEDLVNLSNEIASLQEDIEATIEDIIAEMESLPQNSQVIETYTRLETLEEQLAELKTEIEELSPAGDTSELETRIANIEAKNSEILNTIEELTETDNEFVTIYTDLSERVDTIEETVVPISKINSIVEEAKDELGSSITEIDNRYSINEQAIADLRREVEALSESGQSVDAITDEELEDILV